jgi:hypothetical protein
MLVYNLESHKPVAKVFIIFRFCNMLSNFNVYIFKQSVKVSIFLIFY